MAKTETKNKIIMVGAEIIRKKGFNNTGIQEILQEANVPKGSFYFYFKSKEDFGVELIKAYRQFFVMLMNKHFLVSEISGKQKLRNFFDDRLAVMKSDNFEGGCPIGNLSQEMGDLNEAMRFELKTSLETMADMIQKCIDESIKTGEITTEKNSGILAHYILNSWEGALLRVKVDKNSDALEQFDDFTFNYLLN